MRTLLRHCWRGLTVVALIPVLLACSRASASPVPGQHHPNRILVMPTGTSVLFELTALHAQNHCRVLAEISGQGNLQVVELPSGQSVSKAVARYQASGLVRFAEPDYVVSTAATLPNDSFFQNGTQWWLNNYGQNGGLPDADVDAPEAWDVRHSAPDVVVAVVDSGVQLTHADLADNLWINPADGSHGFNALTGTHDPSDDNGHGTHVAGIIGAVGNNTQGISGIAWDVRIMACKFLDASGDGFNSDAVTCIEFARTNDAHIINLSWGGSEYSAAVSNAVWHAREDNILVVAAAGNEARNIDSNPYFPAGIQLDNVLSVGASTRTDAAWFLSNYGSTNVDLFAPGLSIHSTTANTTSDFSYTTESGTSMASACVAGALALLRQQEPAASAQHLKARLLAAVDAKPAFAGRCVSNGRLNLRKALDLPAISISPETWPPELRLTGVPSHFYTLSATTNLVDWTALATNVADSSGQWIFIDAESTVHPSRLYRAIPAP
jgi:subtilisin family serine protease